MEVLLYTLEFGLQVHTAYCRKCSVPNALSVMKNNMGSSTISKFKKGFQLWEGSFWGNCDILTSAPLLCLLEVEQVNFCTIIHCLALLTIKFSNLFFLKRSPSQKMSGMEKSYIYCYSKILASVLPREELLILLINLQMQNSWLQTSIFANLHSFV